MMPETRRSISAVLRRTSSASRVSPGSGRSSGRRASKATEQGPPRPADLVLGAPLEQPPGADRARLHPHHGHVLGLDQQQGQRGRARCPPGGRAGPRCASGRRRRSPRAPGAGRRGRSKEKYLQLSSSSGPTSTEALNTSSSSQIGTWRLRISAKVVQLSRRLRPTSWGATSTQARIAPDLDEHRAVIPAAIAPLDAPGDSPSALRLRLVERDPASRGPPAAARSRGT